MTLFGHAELRSEEVFVPLGDTAPHRDFHCTIYRQITDGWAVSYEANSGAWCHFIYPPKTLEVAA